MTAPSITREQVSALLHRYRSAQEGPPPEPVVLAWLRRLEDYSLGECEAALLALGPNARTATPTLIAQRIDDARHQRTAATTQPATPPGGNVVWMRDAVRTRHREAGWRGIQAVYAAMGWQRNPTTDAARMRPCPFCHAKPGELCGPLSRNRAGHREQRDPATRMHPSRLATNQNLETT
jgi:hypothetical protein